MRLRDAIADPDRLVLLYGTTPPRLDAGEERIRRAASRLAQRTRDLPLDGIVVYDVQDESARTEEERPFPFMPMIDARVYASMLRDLTGREPLTYQCVSAVPEHLWTRWLDETASSYGLNTISLVGAASSKSAAGTPLATALDMAARHPARFLIGGVVILERHSTARSESRRLMRKAEAGCEYFISQAVYSPALTVRLIEDYLADCGRSGARPRRIILTFTPCGRVETMRFMEWLGISIPSETQRALLGESPLRASLTLCADNLRSILDRVAGRGVPLGINVESVSNKKDEILGSVDLCGKLAEISAEYV